MDDSVGEGWRTTVDRRRMVISMLFENARTEGDGVVRTVRGGYKGPQFGGTLSINGVVGTDEFKNESYFTDHLQQAKPLSAARRMIGARSASTTPPTSRRSWSGKRLASFKLAVGSFDCNRRRDLASGSRSSCSRSRPRRVSGSVGPCCVTPMSPELSFEGGGEIAYNYREQQVALTQNGARDSAAGVRRAGRGNARRGVRAGKLGGRRRSGRSRAAFASSVRRSTQSGDTQKERSFTYPKPRLVATWSPSKDDQLRVRAEREVGQLNFQEFASEVDLNSGLAEHRQLRSRAEQDLGLRSRLREALLGRRRCGAYPSAMKTLPTSWICSPARAGRHGQ
jgi:hypothetical protein